MVPHPSFRQTSPAPDRDARREPAWRAEPNLADDASTGCGGHAARVVAAVDVGLGGRPALNARIVRIAASLVRPADGSLHVVHAWSIAAESVLTCPVRGLGRARVSALRRWTRAERLRRLEALVAAEACGRRVHVILEHGRPGSVVRRTALRVGAELVVIGAVHPPCWPGMVIGSMAEALAGGVDYSVLLVRSGDVAPDTRAASTP